MRVLYVITRADTVGGAQVHVRDLARQLLADGHAVTVMTGSPGPYAKLLESEGIPTATCGLSSASLSPLADTLSLLRLALWCRRQRPDVVSLHSTKAGLVGRAACRAAGTPCVFTAHGWSFASGVPGRSLGFYRLLERLSAPLAQRIICVSEYDRLAAIRAGIAPARLRRIYNGMPDIPEELRARPSDPGPAVITMTARFDEPKDHLGLLQAVRGLSNSTYRLQFVGDGSRLADTVQAAERLGLAEQVTFLGARADVAAVLARSHIFALVSRSEGFPRSTLEAMRGGLPVVVSDVGGASEAVLEGETGFVVPSGDIDALRQRLKQLVEDPDMRERMGRAGRRRYEEHFTFRRMYGETCQVYKEIAPRGRWQPHDG